MFTDLGNGLGYGLPARAGIAAGAGGRGHSGGGGGGGGVYIKGEGPRVYFPDTSDGVGFGAGGGVKRRGLPGAVYIILDKHIN